MRKLAYPNAQLSFYFPIFPIELENDKRAAFDLSFSIKLFELVPVQQQLADTFCGRNFVAGALVGLDVGIVKKRFAMVDSRERIADI